MGNPLSAVGNLATQRFLRPRSYEEPHTLPAMAFPNAHLILRNLDVNIPLVAMHDEATCAARGTPAFTDGMVTHFASDHPDIHIAAHEAAHQLQHRGVTYEMGLGPEGHACAIADTIAKGLPAATLISKRGHRVPSAVRNYRDTDGAGNWGDDLKSVPFARLSETGEAFVPGGHLAYATSGLISQATGVLEAKRSGVHIAAGAGGIAVKAPDGSGTKTLRQIDAKFDVDVKGEGKSPEDCRETAKQIMGPHTESDDPAPPEVIVCRQDGTATKLSGKPGELVWFAIFLDQRIAATSDYAKMTPEEKQAVQKKAREDFDDMSDEQKQDFKNKAKISPERAKELGIDQGAEPAVGEAYGVFSREKAKEGDWRFHYAAVIMVTGEDRVTLENADVNPDKFAKPGRLSATWFFSMYGPASKGQSFYDEDQRKTHDPGRHVGVLVTQPGAPPDVAEFAKTPTQTLMARRIKSADPDEQYYLDNELAHRTITAQVEVRKKNSLVLEDRVSVRVGRAKTNSAKTFEGSSSSLTLSALSVLPASDPLPVVLYEGLIFDSEMGSTTWSSPFGKTTWSISKGGARYALTLSM